MKSRLLLLTRDKKAIDQLQTNSWILPLKNSNLPILVLLTKRVERNKLLILLLVIQSIGEPRVLSKPLKIKVNVVHVGPSLQLDALNQLISFSRELQVTSQNNNWLIVHKIMETKVAMEDGWTMPSNMLLLMVLPLNKLIHMLPMTNNANNKEVSSKLLDLMMSTKVIAILLRPSLPRLQLQLLQMLKTGHSMPEVFSMIVVIAQITVSQLLVTLTTTGLLRIHGEPVGENKVTLDYLQQILVVFVMLPHKFIFEFTNKIHDLFMTR